MESREVVSFFFLIKEHVKEVAAEIRRDDEETWRCKDLIECNNLGRAYNILVTAANGGDMEVVARGCYCHGSVMVLAQAQRQRPRGWGAFLDSWHSVWNITTPN